MSKETENDDDWFYQETERWAELKSEPTTVLLDLLCDDDELTRFVAAKELHMRGERVAFDRAVELRGSAEGHVREIAAFLLGQLGTPKFPFKEETVPLLEPMLTTDPWPRVREAAAIGLGHLKATTALQSLLGKAGDPDPGVRGGVAVALGSLGSPEAFPALKALYQDEDEEVRGWAELGLELLDLDDADRE